MKFITKLVQPIIGLFINMTSPIHDILNRVANGLPIFWGGAMDMNFKIRRLLLSGTQSKVLSSHELFSATLSSRKYAYDSSGLAGAESFWMSYLDLQQRLPELMLPRLDRMGMAHSIEGRVPFLDHRIVEYIASVPEKVMQEKINEGKSALKAIAHKTLGNDFVFRKKKGFQAPVSEWKKGVLKEWVAYLELFAHRTRIFNPKGIKALVKHGGRRYFTLVNFMIWYLIYIDNVLLDKLPNLKRWDQY